MADDERPADRHCISPTCHDDHPPMLQAMICRPALNRLVRTVGEMAALWDWLGQQLAAGSGGNEAPVSGSRERPLPISVNAHDLRVEIVAVMNSWCRMVAEERSFRGPWRKPALPQGPRNRPDLADLDRQRLQIEQTATINDLAAWLVNQIDWAAQQPWVDELITELSDLSRRSHAAAPTRPGRHDLPAPCPAEDCGMRSLCRYDGDDNVYCRSCNATWSESHYKMLVAVLADEARRAS